MFREFGNHRRIPVIPGYLVIEVLAVLVLLGRMVISFFGVNGATVNEGQQLALVVVVVA